jgi:hypothetical protein
VLKKNQLSNIFDNEKVFPFHSFALNVKSIQENHREKYSSSGSEQSHQVQLSRYSLKKLRKIIKLNKSI